MDRLPIYDIEDRIVEALKHHRRLVLQAPTGSGKSTQVPQILLNHGLLERGQVLILQPRRLAARLLANRVARERGCPVGSEAGYRVRFENVTSAATRIQYETEGVLLRRMIQDPALDGVQAVIFDEFHERHLYGDISLARALAIQEQSRPDLLIVVMSATLEACAVERYLKPCAVLTSEGRTFPVRVEYLARRQGRDSSPVWDLAAEAFARYSRTIAGDVLVFMPGRFEIHRTIEAIRHRSESKGYVLLPLHGELNPADQDAAVSRYEQPKVVVATNVAETSITIDGVRLVIDSGLARIPRYDPNRGINTLLVERISQSSAEQRTGRAGRTTSGLCVRLWTEAEHAERAQRDAPEIQRLDLSEAILTVKAAGVEDLNRFRWIEPPPEKSIAHAEELLEDLGALKPDLRTSTPGQPRFTRITPLGRRMLAFPVHPRYSRMLIAAEEYQCVYEACLAAALTQGHDLLLRNVSKDVQSRRDELFGDGAKSDFTILIRSWRYAAEQRFQLEPLRTAGIHAGAARQVGPLLDQLLKIAREEGLDIRERTSDEQALRKCLLIGFSDRIARRVDDSTLRCELVRGRRGMLSRDSSVRDQALLVAAEIQEIGGRGGEVSTILSLVSAIEMDWLRELYPGEIGSDVRVTYDPPARRVQAEQAVEFRGLVLSSKKVEPPPADKAAQLLAGEVMSGRLQLPNWDHAVEQWILRLNLLAEVCPDLQLPPLPDDGRRHIIEQLCIGASSYRDLKDRDVKPAVQSWIRREQRELVNKHAPERVTLSNGRTPKVSYEAGAAPSISLRIQELYGVAETPRIALGRMPLRVHILAPSMRPVQVTQDLASFWRDHYPKIKPELQRRYPKHEWR